MTSQEDSSTSKPQPQKRKPTLLIRRFVQQLADDGKTPNEITSAIYAAIATTFPDYRPSRYYNDRWQLDRVCSVCGSNIAPWERLCSQWSSHPNKKDRGTAILRREYEAAQAVAKSLIEMDAHAAE
jgi:hypothetical protein